MPVSPFADFLDPFGSISAYSYGSERIVFCLAQCSDLSSLYHITALLVQVIRIGHVPHRMMSQDTQRRNST